jgi:hypothetical protein
MQITSTAFGQNQAIPSIYTCDGRNISPPLSINGVPTAAKSLVLIVDDPDAPSGDFVHWLAWNISPDTKEIAENSIPSGGIEGTADFEKPGWGGPCPPSGTHRYQFKIYALDNELNLVPSARKKDLENAMVGHILDQAQLTGLYKRK